jgi:hypothetical protein
MNLENLGGRRFILSILVLLFTSILTAWGKVDGLVYAGVVVPTVGALIAGHTFQNVKEVQAGITVP